MAEFEHASVQQQQHGGGQNVFLTQGNEVGVDRERAEMGTSAASLLLQQQQQQPQQSTTAPASVAAGVVGGAHASPSTRLHHKLREMKEMDDALALMKGDYAERIRVVQEGEAKFLVKQHNIRQYLKRFKLFILESDAKRARAEKKEADEQKQRAAKLREIEQQRALFLQLQSRRSDLKQKNDHYKQNRSYLEAVKDSVPEQYGEIDELIVRYQILKQTNTDLSEANRAASASLEKVTAELQSLYKTKQNAILVMNSRFAHLLQKLESVSNDASSIENEVAAGELRTRDMQRYFCEVQMAVRNIYQRTMSSLPSKKAQTQIKKRMQQATLAAAAAAANDTAAATSAAAAAAAAAAAHSRSAAHAASTSAATASSTSGSGGGGALDSDDDDDDLASRHAAAYAASGVDLSNNSADAATAAQSALQNQKHAQVKAHLIQLLDAIAERLVDLQFIVDQVYPNGVQLLREGGALYSAGAAAATAMVGGVAGAAANAAQAGGLSERGGGGQRRAGASGRHNNGDSSTADSSRRGTGAAASLRSVAGKGTPSHKAARSRGLNTDDSDADLHHTMQHSNSSSALSSPSHGASQAGFSAADRALALENKMRLINAQLAQSGTGLLLNLPDKSHFIPANQKARTEAEEAERVARAQRRQPRPSVMLGAPPAMGAGAGQQQQHRGSFMVNSGGGGGGGGAGAAGLPLLGKSPRRSP
jgi:hypothetical protein